MIFIDFDFIYWLLRDLTTRGTTPTLTFERAADLNCEKLGAHKPGQYQPSEEDFKPGFKENIRFFRFFKKVTMFDPWTNLLLACSQFSFLDKQMNR